MSKESSQSRNPVSSLGDFRLDRRSLVKSAAAGTSLFLMSMGLPAGTTLAAQSTGEPPADAAPKEEQVFRIASDPAIAKTMNFYEAVYQRPGIADLFSESLVRLTKDFEIVPGAALKWSSSKDGKTWTFELDPNLVWSDGNPLTAKDYVRTFQYAADPQHAWDFTWFWSGDIVNFTEATAGKAKLTDIGVKEGANPHELIFEMVNPAPYLAAKLLYSWPISDAALTKHGAFYNSKPETSVTCGPFKLDKWTLDQEIVFTRWDGYKGKLNIPFQTIINKFAAPAQSYTIYDAGEIDYMADPAPAELKLMEADPSKKDEIFQGVADFACLYFFFDVTKAPFDNLKVRQAFSHVVDRDTMQKQIWGRQAKPAPSFLAPGFPASNTEGLKDIQKFDPALGKQLLSEAGFPDGKGFPKLTLTVRGGGTPVEVATTQAYGAALKQYLNLNVELQTIDRQAFYADLNAKPTKILFGWVSYGMDYFDPSNMLGVWLSGGRHSYSSPEYDKKVKEATTFLGPADQRIKMFQDAERILVSDVPAVFTYFITTIQFMKPYVRGDALTADKNKIAAIHFPGFSTADTVLEGLYVTKDAPKGRN